ncbi:MAG: PAS domain-containing sensor histidine kinase [Nostoc sp. NMS1]|uniref:ATP-binding protein n=1 Tax=unclassified Nostoc TaxID=2593658 RepID=UPI0025F38DC8|nr:MULTISPECIES: ATP-binding protein [unclassified Nostoc]MBN3910373.1 PAS domain-containing sensor histidine kinase [Nostoc sp. NMS1]MBN3994793.1 PAS domain-containing sensor histidine kinase [Nostoc sp. NMS2]
MINAFDQFLVVAQILPEPLLLVTSAGEILAVNQPAARLFSKTSKALIGQRLTEFVTDSSDKIIDYLRACSQSRQMILGALTIHQDQGEGIPCCSQGAVIQPREAESPAINLLRLEKRTSNQFVLLNQKIHALSKEIQQRQRIEVELSQSNETLRQTLIKLQNALEAVQTEKMSGLGHLVAGIAHEINNPVSFIYGNLTYASEYYNNLLQLIHLYQQEYPNPSLVIQQEIQVLDIDFIQNDLKKLLQSMQRGSERISEIVKSLRNFSRLDEATFKVVDIHEGLEAALMILQSRLNPSHQHSGIEVIKEYGELPWISCSPGQLNQVFMHLLNNAIDALEEAEQVRWSATDRRSSPQPMQNDPSRIWIRTDKLSDRYIRIRIKDNGSGIPTQIHHQIFNPFFTTKPVGKGTGLGLSICYQIIESHDGQINVISDRAWGTEFSIELPIV